MGFAGFLFWAVARADPAVSPEWLLIEDSHRSEGAHWLAGSSEGLDTPFDVDGAWSELSFRVRLFAAASGGHLVPIRHLGDEEPGVFSLRDGLELQAQSSLLEFRLASELWMDAPLGEDLLGASVEFPEYFAGIHWDWGRLGFGAEKRFIGPGRHGSLLLTDEARPYPGGVLSLNGKRERLGLMRAEIGAGWLQRPREDVAYPGLLHMDFRIAPFPWLELGASRMSLFGGVGRPKPSIWELLVPLQPHVENDPTGKLADQNEIAALDLRLSLPLGQWVDGPLRFVEAWYQYGGEDMIVREVGGIPLPSLAGVANLYGFELGIGGAVLTLERAVLMDDTFRWYTGHRVYHQGFTQSGHSLGHPVGGDAESLWLGARWSLGPLGLEAWVEDLRRVGVVENLDGNVLTLSVDEEGWRAGLRGWKLERPGGWWGTGVEVERLHGVGFVPGADASSVRVWAERRGAWRMAAESL